MSDGAVSEQERHLAAFVVAAAQVTSNTIAQTERLGGEIARALWPDGETPPAYTWRTLSARALARARERDLEDVAARLEGLRADALDTALRGEGVLGASTISELMTVSGRLLFEWTERIQDAPSDEERWLLTKSGAVLQWQFLLGVTALHALIPEPDKLLGPLERMIDKAETLVARCRHPELLPPPDPADTEYLQRHATAQRERLAREHATDEEEPDEEPERSPEETLARIERVASELERIAAPLGRHVDDVLFGGAPAEPTTWALLIARIEERLSQERDSVMAEAAASLDVALLVVGPPAPGTETLLRRAAERLAIAGEKIRAASSREHASTIANAAETMLRLVAAHAFGIAVGTGEEQLVERLARLLGMK